MGTHAQTMLPPAPRRWNVMCQPTADIWQWVACVCVCEREGEYAYVCVVCVYVHMCMWKWCEVPTNCIRVFWKVTFVYRPGILNEDFETQYVRWQFHINGTSEVLFVLQPGT